MWKSSLIALRTKLTTFAIFFPKKPKKAFISSLFSRHLASFDHFTWPLCPLLTLVVLPRPGPRLPRVEGGPLRDVAGEGGRRAAGAGAGGGQRQFAAEVEEKNKAINDAGNKRACGACKLW